MEAKAEKTALAEQRVQKKAARRAAFIQEVAEAIAVKVCGPSIKRSPFAQAYHEEDMGSWRAGKVREDEAAGLRWAIERGLLPNGTTHLPSNETQLYLLANLGDKADASA